MTTSTVDAVRITDDTLGALRVSNRRTVGTKASALAGYRVDMLWQQQTFTSMVHLPNSSEN